jgi:hypothetical protein
MKPDQKAAREFAERWKNIKIKNEGGNLAAAYLELERLARAILHDPQLGRIVLRDENDLRDFLGED